MLLCPIKDTKNCPFPWFQHVDTSSYLVLIIFEPKPISKFLKHGVLLCFATHFQCRRETPLDSPLFTRVLTCTAVSVNSAKNCPKKTQWRSIFEMKVNFSQEIVPLSWPVLYASLREAFLFVIHVLELEISAILKENT